MGKKILVAEDDPYCVRLLDYRLKSWGYDVIHAGDGREAVEFATKVKPDLVLLDIMMPFMDGMQALRKLKFQEDTKDIPVIMVTAKVQEGDIVGCLECGAVDYITKPFSLAELSARVNNALASHNRL